MNYRKVRKYCKYLLLPLLMGYFMVTYTVTRDKHCHILADGRLIFHFHPVDHDQNLPLKNHTHSSGNIYDFQVNFLDYQEPPVFRNALVVPVILREEPIADNQHFIEKSILVHSPLRAPPGKNS